MLGHCRRSSPQWFSKEALFLTNAPICPETLEGPSHAVNKLFLQLCCEYSLLSMPGSRHDRLPQQNGSVIATKLRFWSRDSPSDRYLYQACPGCKVADRASYSSALLALYEILPSIARLSKPCNAQQHYRTETSMSTFSGVQDFG
jgi:hypothetical protein